jgi:hypothetical protein
LNSSINGSNSAGINIWNKNDYLMAQDYELDRYFFYENATASSNPTSSNTASVSSPHAAQNTSYQNRFTPSYTDIIDIAGVGGYFSSPECTTGNGFSLATVQLRQWFNEKLSYIQSAYKNASGLLKWTNSSKTATVEMSANEYSVYAAFTDGRDGSYIDSNNFMWVKESLLWQIFGNVIDPPLDHHPVRDAVVAGVAIGTVVSAPSLIKSAAPYVAPIADKLKEGVSYVLDKVYASVDYIGNRVSNFMYDKVPRTVDVVNIRNNPIDEFVTIGPKDGLIGEYIKSISTTGDYGKIYVTELSNGLYQLADGHHRFAALLRLGYDKITVYITK